VQSRGSHMLSRLSSRSGDGAATSAAGRSRSDERSRDSHILQDPSGFAGPAGGERTGTPFATGAASGGARTTAPAAASAVAAAADATPAAPSAPPHAASAAVVPGDAAIDDAAMDDAAMDHVVDAAMASTHVDGGAAARRSARAQTAVSQYSPSKEWSSYDLERCGERHGRVRDESYSELKERAARLELNLKAEAAAHRALAEQVAASRGEALKGGSACSAAESAVAELLQSALVDSLDSGAMWQEEVVVRLRLSASGFSGIGGVRTSYSLLVREPGEQVEEEELEPQPTPAAAATAAPSTDPSTARAAAAATTAATIATATTTTTNTTTATTTANVGAATTTTATAAAPSISSAAAVTAATAATATTTASRRNPFAAMMAGGGVYQPSCVAATTATTTTTATTSMAPTVSCSILHPQLNMKTRSERATHVP
jgi:hypothetical protein